MSAVGVIGSVTVRFAVASCTVDPEVPVTLNVEAVGNAPAAAETVSVDESPAATLAGEKLPVAPDGKFATVSVML